MSNWAIVIGVNDYPQAPGMNLHGAVNDALRMCDWLLGAGGVPTAQMRLLLSPVTAGAAQAPGVVAKEATQDQIIETIYEVVRTSGGGDRFFFHYSGHGLTSRIGFSDEEALIPSDFKPLLTTKSLSVRSILEQFEAVQFAEQFFFVDACRNMPWEIEFEIGKLPLPARRNPDQPAPQQFVMQATSPGLKAAEMALAGDEAGAFTDALLAGLKGAGRAKLWDPGAARYVVRYDRLFDYVVATVAARQLPVGQNNRRVFQIPKRSGEQGQVTGNNPVLAELNETDVQRERLEVVVDPFGPPNEAKVNVRAAFDDAGSHVVSALPFQIDLQPREYMLQCDATGFEDENRRRVIELYEPKRVDVRLRALPPPPPPPPAAAPMSMPTPAGADLDFGIPSPAARSTARSRGAAPAAPSSTPVPKVATGPASLTLRSHDSMAQLELLDASGGSLGVAFGTLSRSGLAPGLYRARLVTPEGKSVEQWVPVGAGESSDVHLQAPDVSPAIHSLAGQTNFQFREDNTIIVSETVGALASAELSTILALAGVTAGRTGDAFRLRQLGVEPFASAFPGADRGVQCLAGDESQDDDPDLGLIHARLRLWPQGEPVPAQESTLTPLPVAARIGQFAAPVGPEPHWLSLSLPRQKSMVLNVASVPNRITLFVLHRQRDSSFALYAYMPGFDASHQTDPAETRKLELIQRYSSAGSYASAWSLLEIKTADPVAGCLGAYVLMRLGRARELDVVQTNMRGLYDGLSDSHVIAAVHAESRHEPARAAAHYRDALDRGLPIFADGLRMLVDGVQRHHLDHPRVRLLRRVWERRVQGILWTAWSPETFTPGQRLDA